ncbi:DUF6691 family protein [Kordiimonas sp. SCSIO 12610]|uniref:DUF6691 family protein n=1 Tax=Kordiimonas sp. SCSIO 12610 TaxID=2829597 RepID=UPI002109A445|nr:DUF6691 family protein [Kordiimonas sp. SCSIO 12610]UTW54652.1 YeeE/YedE family protein [Kordiimonas sp. SCSIO 12610]
MRHIITFSAGLLFSFGLIVSEMINPQKVIRFLDVFGNWDPSLAFVMAGAVSVNLIGFRLITKRTNPLYAGEFLIPNRTDVDHDLIIGATCFGIGWGLVGLCPGPAIAALTAAPEQAALFVFSMLAGMFIARLRGQKPSLQFLE